MTARRTAAGTRRQQQAHSKEVAAAARAVAWQGRATPGNAQATLTGPGVRARGRRAQAVEHANLHTAPGNGTPDVHIRHSQQGAHHRRARLPRRPRRLQGARHQRGAHHRCSRLPRQPHRLQGARHQQGAHHRCSRLPRRPSRGMPHAPSPPAKVARPEAPYMSRCPQPAAFGLPVEALPRRGHEKAPGHRWLWPQVICLYTRIDPKRRSGRCDAKAEMPRRRRYGGTCQHPHDQDQECHEHDGGGEAHVAAARGDHIAAAHRDAQRVDGLTRDARRGQGRTPERCEYGSQPRRCSPAVTPPQRLRRQRVDRRILHIPLVIVRGARNRNDPPPAVAACMLFARAARCMWGHDAGGKKKPCHPRVRARDALVRKVGVEWCSASWSFVLAGPGFVGGALVGERSGWLAGRS